MSDRKLSSIEIEAEQAAKHLAEMPSEWFASGVMPLAAMQAAAALRQMGARIARVERDLDTERRLHRSTEALLSAVRTERDIARRERDERDASWFDRLRSPT